MNYRMIFYLSGYVLNVEAVAMLFPLLIALYEKETSSVWAFLATIVLLLALGLPLSRRAPQNKSIYAKEGFWIVAFAWVIISFFGSLPYVFSGAIPSFLNAFFESVSGFTTTGASILADVESLPASLLFWRSLTHWLGGMGVLILILSISSLTGGNSLHLIRAESTGPAPSKLVPKIKDTAKILYSIYLGLSLLQIIMLCLGGMSFFDSLVNTFSTAGTGGFAVKNSSIGAYDSVYLEMVIGVFMLLFGINFHVLYLVLIRHFRQAARHEELWAYLIIVAIAVITISLDLFNTAYHSLGESARYAFFQTVSTITTSGFMTADYNNWPAYSKSVLLLLMFLGACAGSTAGGVKIDRLVIVVKNAFRHLRKLAHPRSVDVVHYNGKKLEEDTIGSVYLFFSLYFMIFAVSIVVLSLGGYSLETTFSAVLATINNIGPGFDQVGPMANYDFIFPAGKIMLIFNMLVGRLEIFPIIMLFAPGLWRIGRRRKKPGSI